MRAFFMILLLSGGLSACSSGRGVTPADRAAFTAAARAEEARLDVPLIVQEKNHCGPATLTMALRRFDPEASLALVTEMTFTPGAEGSFQTDLLAAARRAGFAPYQVDSLAGMARAVDEGLPVVVFQNLGLPVYPVWHYALVTGYDRGRGELLLHTGDQAHARVPLARFAKSWERGDRWSYVILPHDRVPAGAPLDEALANAEVFGREGQGARAMALYRRIGELYPDAFEGPAGLGLQAAALGEDRVALAAFREALRRAPGHPGLLHNLQLLERRVQ